MKKTIRLTEGDLHKIIKESVKKILKEDYNKSHFYNLDPQGDRLSEVMEVDDGYYTIQRYGDSYILGKRGQASGRVMPAKEIEKILHLEPGSIEKTLPPL
jgi:hypothetical protein